MKAFRAIAALALCMALALGLAACGGSSGDTGSGQAPSLAAGLAHTAMLNSEGTVWIWGRNEVGQLGNGSTEDSTTPVLGKVLTGVAAVVVGDYHTAALKKTGRCRPEGIMDSASLATTRLIIVPPPVLVKGFTM